jgi:hypothetical protein
MENQVGAIAWSCSATIRVHEFATRVLKLEFATATAIINSLESQSLFATHTTEAAFMEDQLGAIDWAC